METEKICTVRHVYGLNICCKASTFHTLYS